MDIKKLKYDLAMQCASIEMQKVMKDKEGDISFELRTEMLNCFDSYYAFYTAMDDTNFEHFKNL